MNYLGPPVLHFSHSNDAPSDCSKSVNTGQLFVLGRAFLFQLARMPYYTLRVKRFRHRDAFLPVIVSITPPPTAT